MSIESRPAFPITAVVGHDDAKLALFLNAIDPSIGGVLLTGQKGSAKSTMARGLAALLAHNAPFVELPLGATEDRVVGTLDLEAALVEGKKLLMPGLVAAAHGGVLYVDEINLLADHLVDVLLDVAASGVNVIEREGISESHEARFVLVGSMNPEEGELRPQLLDRFGLAVEVSAQLDHHLRAEAVQRRLAFDSHPEGLVSAFSGESRELANQLSGARETLAAVHMSDDSVAMVSRLCVCAEAEGLRADLVICRAAKALAALEDRKEVDASDIRRVAPLALAHRRRKMPFDRSRHDPDELQRIVDEALDPPRADPRGSPTATTREDSSSSWDAGSRTTNEREGAHREGTHREGTDHEGTGAKGAGVPPIATVRAPEDTKAPVAPDASTRMVSLPLQRSAASSQSSGRSAYATGRRGRLVTDRAVDGPLGGLAVGATVRAAAVRIATAALEDRADRYGPGALHSAAPDTTALHTQAPDPRSRALVTRDDLREAVREQKTGSLVVLAVDASRSMGAEGRMDMVKGAIFDLLLHAYHRRDRVALVTFAGEGAAIALRPTSSVEVARARVSELHSGGRTPLAAGIRKALDVASAPALTHSPLIVLVSDGRATYDEGNLDPFRAACAAAEEVRRRKVRALVVDTEGQGISLGLAGEIARAMGADHITLPDLSAPALSGAVRTALG